MTRLSKSGEIAHESNSDHISITLCEINGGSAVAYLKGYSTPYFDFCSKCSICTIKTYERQKEREKENLTAENCTRKAKFPPIRRPEVKLTIFGHVISDVKGELD